MRKFSARETAWLEELDGIELAPFWRRALALLIDVLLLAIPLAFSTAGLGFLYLKYLEMHGHPLPAHAHFAVGPGKFELQSSDPYLNRTIENEWMRLLTEVLLPILYFGVLTWLGKGRSPGKWLLRIRVVSLVHRHLSFWHAVERALGYGAAALEGGFGFVQFFIHPYRRCVQDRIAETIVVTERSFREYVGRAPESTHTPAPALAAATEDEGPTGAT